MQGNVLLAVLTLLVAMMLLGAVMIPGRTPDKPERKHRPD